MESAGGNCHRVVWDGVTGGTGYQVAYSVDGADWRYVSTVETGCLVEGLGYGQTVTYRVKTLGDGVTTTDSDWSATVSLVVCPMDVDGDGLISASDASLISAAWLTRPGSDGWDARCDVNRDGIVSSADWSFLSANWLRSSTDDDLLYPPYRSPSLDESIFGSEWDGLF